MKLTLPTFKKKNLAPKKFRVDARRYWTILLSSFVLLLTIELIYFSLSFIQTSARLSAPATPTLETNDANIKHMEDKLKTIEQAISTRTGSPISQ